MDGRRLPKDLVERVLPHNLLEYANATGWQLVRAPIDGVVVIRRGAAEALVPTTDEFADRTERVGQAVATIARAQARSPRELLTELLMPPADMLRFRVKAESTRLGFLPLSDAGDLFEACRSSLMAAACMVVEPKRHYPRLSRKEAGSFLQDCRIGAERGSFVATVACPLDAGETASSSISQLTFGEPWAKRSATFSRRVVETVMRASHTLSKALEEDTLDSVASEPVDSTSLSSNFCDAIGSMDPGADDIELVLEAELSPLIAPPTDFPARFVWTTKQLRLIAGLASRLRPAEEATRVRTFIGLVDSLHGGPIEENLVGGGIVVALPPDEGRQRRVRLDLYPDDYRSACDAHKLAQYVQFKGLLKPGGRIGAVERVQDFRVMP